MNHILIYILSNLWWPLSGWQLTNLEYNGCLSICVSPSENPTPAPELSQTAFHLNSNWNCALKQLCFKAFCFNWNSKSQITFSTINYTVQSEVGTVTHLIDKEMKSNRLWISSMGDIRLRKAEVGIRSNEASLSGESGLSWLQMGQLGHDETLWKGECLKRDAVQRLIFLGEDKWTPAGQFDMGLKIQRVQRQRW